MLSLYPSWQRVSTAAQITSSDKVKVFRRDIKSPANTDIMNPTSTKYLYHMKDSSLTNYPSLCVFIQMCSNVSHHTQDMAAGCHSYIFWTNIKRVFTQIMGGLYQAHNANKKGRHKHLIMLSQASRILSNRILGDVGTTKESSSQAPAACSASVCEIKLVRNAGVNLFCLDQMVKALLKYRLRRKGCIKNCFWGYCFLIRNYPRLNKPQIITFFCLKIILFFSYRFF